MPFHFVSDYEALTGETVEAATKRFTDAAEAKVVEAPKKPAAKTSAAVVETK